MKVTPQRSAPSARLRRTARWSELSVAVGGRRSTTLSTNIDLVLMGLTPFSRSNSAESMVSHGHGDIMWPTARAVERTESGASTVNRFSFDVMKRRLGGLRISHPHKTRRMQTKDFKHLLKPFFVSVFAMSAGIGAISDFPALRGVSQVIVNFCFEFLVRAEGHYLALGLEQFRQAGFPVGNLKGATPRSLEECTVNTLDFAGRDCVNDDFRRKIGFGLFLRSDVIMGIAVLDR